MAEYAVVLAVIAIGIFAALGFLSGAHRRRARARSRATSRNRTTGLFPGPSTELAAELRSSAASLLFGDISGDAVRGASREQAAQRLLARAALDERADLGGARRDERHVALAHGRLLGQVAGAQERLADLERERALVARRSRARGGGTRCGSRRTCPCRRGGAACGARRGGAAAGRRRWPDRLPAPRRSPASRLATRRLDLGRERRRSRAAAEAGGDLGAPEPALLGRGLGLVEIARRAAARARARTRSSSCA